MDQATGCVRRRAEPITGQDGKRARGEGGGGARLDASAKWTGAKQRGKELAARREPGASAIVGELRNGRPLARHGRREGRQRWAWGRQRMTRRRQRGMLPGGARRACQNTHGACPRRKRGRSEERAWRGRDQRLQQWNASAAVSSFSFRSPFLSSFPLEMADHPDQPCLNMSPWPYFGSVYGTGVTRQMEGFARCPAAHA